MGKDYEILEINKGEKTAKIFRKVAIAVNTIALALGLAVTGVSLINNSQYESKVTSQYVFVNNEMYEKVITTINPIVVNNGDGAKSYVAPTGYNIMGSGPDTICYKIEYIKVDSKNVAPDGFVLNESNDKAYKAKELGLVDASYVPEEGYHLEQYEKGDNYFYVIMDGYHNESGYLVKDGYTLEGNKIVKTLNR